VKDKRFLPTFMIKELMTYTTKKHGTYTIGVVFVGMIKGIHIYISLN
jgi:hypothetical protein